MQKLIHSQEDERMRIASELHDSLGQRLVIINTMAQLSLRHSVNDATNQAFSEISTEALAAIDDTRSIAYDLRPIHLEQLGLTSSIEELVTKLSAMTDIEVSSQLDNIDDILPDHLQINLYRIVQEALSNVAKYSSATTASVNIERTAERTTVVIRDNGIGFRVENNMNTEGRKGMGLRGMAERAILIGATYVVRTAPGQGTEVRIDVNLKKPQVPAAPVL
jgi:signal transduction histidine kinase